jgi:hypothetical protein
MTWQVSSSLQFSIGETDPDPASASMPFDTKAGMEAYLTDLAGLNRLIADRHRAGYQDRLRMREWVVLGRWQCDTCGNFGTIRDWKTGSFFPSLIERAKKEPVFDLHSIDKKDCSDWVVSSGTEPPSARVRCWGCGERWHLENCHDALKVEQHRDNVRSSDGWVGRTLGDYERYILDLDDAERWIVFGTKLCGSNLRNDKYIDLTPEKDYPTLKVNERGWVSKPREHVIEEGDEIMVRTIRYYHPFCRMVELKQTERELIRGIFEKAGYQEFEMMAIPNEYCGKPDCCGPWFLVETSLGTIKIGWRKRVFSIDWSRTGQSFLHLFEEEDVTKWPEGIHAWGEKKAAEYLQKIRVHG